MRIARLPFSKSLMYVAGGIEKNVFKSMIDLLPVDAKIVGFGCDLNTNSDYLFVESAGFDEVKPGGIPPDGQAFFTKRADGTISCDKIEWHDQFNRSNASSYVGHVHEWITYTGLHNTETYCKTCGVKDDKNSPTN